MKFLEKILPAITAVFLAAFVAYCLAWYFGKIESNFALILFVASGVTGVYWLFERFYFLPRRRQLAAAAAEGEDRKAKLRQPWWLDWTAGLFPVIIVVFLLRSFLYEPFKIPSGSMLPTLEVGDFILVNKFDYGIRLPVLNEKIVEIGSPQRGDVMVFRYPLNPNQDYIKRVIGLPGDHIEYINKRLTINGKELPVAPLPDYLQTQAVLFGGEVGAAYSRQFRETIPAGQGSVAHRILNDDIRPPFVNPFAEFTEFRDNCDYSAEGVRCIVPAGHYFMMGDNRDNSQDSRYWGFVPDKNIVGKAVLVWMNIGNFQRIGRFQ